MAHQLTRKNFEYPEKGSCKSYIKLSEDQFRRIYAVHSKKQYFGGVSSWGKVCNNPCIVFEINNHSRIEIEEAGLLRTKYLVIKY